MASCAGTRGVFGLTAIFPLIVSVSAVLIAEQPAQQSIASSDGFGASLPVGSWELLSDIGAWGE